VLLYISVATRICPVDIVLMDCKIRAFEFHVTSIPLPTGYIMLISGTISQNRALVLTIKMAMQLGTSVTYNQLGVQIFLAELSAFDREMVTVVEESCVLKGIPAGTLEAGTPPPPPPPV
jgi:hypothetical protein